MASRFGLLMVAAGLALPTVADAASIHEKTTYFAVRGATLGELDRDLNNHGPFVADTGIRHPGATEVKFDGKVTYKATPEGCAVDRTNLSLQLETTLPRWIEPKRVSPRTKLIWETLEKDIRRHEARHSAIAKHWLKRMESAIRNLRPERTCQSMEAMVNTVTRRYLAGHERAQIEFDTIEGREVNFRLRKAFSRAISEQASN
ncbi:DUF922 domain-containing Zn-dependent protease [Jiella sonneratiae]|uniref:DUF922 domain-containing protein n=1 Tax=Jiella sonneratiae TaxID=2816856 RepID=A0ABS3IXH9_9HYPH|nr:DUF922 domain-containing protein [Jiella sonneratiae]MBO0902117.1 DUF922 domain-containing protein [Jiella sonneratiae]